jgi:hypothetical protein
MFDERGEVAIDSNPEQMVFNWTGGGQLGIAAGGNIYCYDLQTNSLTTEQPAAVASNLVTATLRT